METAFARELADPTAVSTPTDQETLYDVAS